MFYCETSTTLLHIFDEASLHSLCPVDPILEDGGQLAAVLTANQLLGLGHGDEQHQLVGQPRAAY